MELKSVYTVIGYEEGGETSWVAGVFIDKEKADHYCKIQNDLNSGDYSLDRFYVSEEAIMDNSVSLDSKVVDYYVYYIQYDDPEDVRDSNEYNDDITIKKVYTKEVFVEDDCMCIAGYSTHSFEEAKEVAFQYYMDTYQ